MSIKEVLFKDRFDINLIFRMIAYFSMILFCILVGFLIEAFISGDIESIVKLLVPIGILLSAALASTSVIKSINNTNTIEKKRKDEEKKINKNKIKYIYKSININTK